MKRNDLQKCVKSIHRKVIGRSQSGMTMVEILIAMVIGLVISAGALSMYSATFQTNMTAFRTAQVNDQISQILQTMTRELRRAGYRGEFATNVFNTVTVSTAGPLIGSCIIYASDTASNDGVLANIERRAFRLNGSVVEWRKSNNAAAPNCNVADNTGWFAMNDASILNVTALTFTKTANPCEVKIDINGQATNDSDIKFSLSNTAAARNLGSC